MVVQTRRVRQDSECKISHVWARMGQFDQQSLSGVKVDGKVEIYLKG